jgi:hypothetical protein
MFSGSLTGQRVSVRSPFVARPANARVNIIQCRSMEAGTLKIETWDGDAGEWGLYEWWLQSRQFTMTILCKALDAPKKQMNEACSWL